MCIGDGLINFGDLRAVRATVRTATTVVAPVAAAVLSTVTAAARIASAAPWAAAIASHKWYFPSSLPLPATLVV